MQKCKYHNTGKAIPAPRREAALSCRQSIEVTKPKHYCKGVFRNAKTGMEHGPMICRIDTIKARAPKGGK